MTPPAVPAKHRSWAFFLFLGFGDEFVHVDVHGSLEGAIRPAVHVLGLSAARIFKDHLGQPPVTLKINVEFFGAGRRRTDVVDVDFVRPEVVLEKVIPLEQPVLVRVHHARAGLYVEPRQAFLQFLELPCRVNGPRPTARFLPNPVVVGFESVKAQRHGDVKFRALGQDAFDIGQNALLDLPVGHQVDGFKLVVFVKRPGNIRQVEAGERFAAGNDQHGEIPPPGSR